MIWNSYIKYFLEKNISKKKKEGRGYKIDIEDDNSVESSTSKCFNAYLNSKYFSTYASYNTLQIDIW